MFENGILRKISGLKENEITEEYRRLHANELYDLYCSPKYFSDDQIKKHEMGGACGTYGVEERWIQVLMGRPDGKRPLGTPKR